MTVLGSRLAEINYLAVLVTGLGTFFLGAVWYMPLFGKLWLRLHGFTEEKQRQMQAAKPPPLFFGGMILCYLVVAFIVALLIVALKVDSAAGGALVGFSFWLGPAAAIQFTGWLASDRHIGTYAIDTSFQLVFLVLMGVFLAVWR